MSARPDVQPYPWASLDSTTRAAAAAHVTMRRWGEQHARLDELAGALGALLETHVAFLLRRVGSFAEFPALDDGAAVVIAPADAPRDLHRAVLIEAEGSLAAAILGRALRRAPPRIPDRTRAPSAAMAGALAAVVTTAARRAHSGYAARVVAAGSATTIVPDFTREAGDGALVAMFTVLLGDDAYLARVILPRGAALRAPAAPWNKRALAALGDIPLALPIVACATAATSADLANLRVGDAWIPGGWPLTRATPAAGPSDTPSRRDGALVGPVHLAAPDVERGIAAELEAFGSDVRLVLRGEVTVLPWTREVSQMESSQTSAAIVEAIGEVPLIVRVEIGTAQMAARAWAELGAGDIVALGRRIADPVVLRVGGVEIARGELVDIDGEVGVRILDRFDATLPGSAGSAVEAT